MAERTADDGEPIQAEISRPDPEEISAHLSRILESPPFVNAHQLRQFLTHLVTSVLEGRGDDLKEYSLGRDVFRRGDSYDPRTDAIVRVQASILRKRLATYYAESGQAEPIRIELPKGGYVPRFLPAPVSGPEPPSTGDLPAPSLERSSARRGWLKAGGGFVAGAAMAGVAQLIRKSSPKPAAALEGEPFSFAAREASPLIWGPLLENGRPIQLAFGCPQFFRGGGLYLRDIDINSAEDPDARERIQKHTHDLGQYLTPAPNTYTGVGEILGIYRMTQFVTFQGAASALENVQLLSPDSIRDRNLILVSSFRFQTILDLLSLPQAFVPRYQGGGAFVPVERQEGEADAYLPATSGGVSRSYGLVSYWTKPETGGRVLLMSGIESWATQGAVMYITAEASLRDLESRLAGKLRDDSKGVQVLVEIQGREDRAVNVHYVTHRVL